MSREPVASSSESGDHARQRTSSAWPVSVRPSEKGTNERSSTGVAQTWTRRPSANATWRPSGEKRTAPTLCFRLRWWTTTRRTTFAISRWPSSSTVSRMTPSGDSARCAMFRRASNGKVNERARTRSKHATRLPTAE